ncbi:MAG: hypothetical protein EOP89_11085, partial [Lysobacteraceae bacterium]
MTARPGEHIGMARKFHVWLLGASLLCAADAIYPVMARDSKPQASVQDARARAAAIVARMT